LRTVHLVLPDGIDDPARPSGGNTYDRNLRRGLTSLGWTVHERPVPGFWSCPGAASFAALDDALRQVPDGSLVVLDGLVASPAPEVLAAHAGRLRLVVLVHMPLGHRPADHVANETRRRERAVLRAADAVVTTSAWSRRRLMELYTLAADRMHVAEPGVEPAELVPATATGEALLCVAAVTPDKGHDVLLEGLAAVRDLRWRCVCVGSLDRDAATAEAVRRRSFELGLGDRVRFAGAATGAELDTAYATADVVLLASRAETYGMVITEALARGLPVIATDVGGVSEALAHSTDGICPGLVVAPDDPGALAGALRAWLSDAELRAGLRRAALQRRQSLSGWSTTTSIIAGVLAALEP
jgi:glycosyltransferase involved in cell wall biosynthesis